MRSLAERNKLAEDNFQLASFFANKYAGKFQSLDFEDLFGYAQLGLVKAAKDFNPALGYTFSTFCGRVIFNILAKAIRKPTIAAVSINTPIAADLTIEDVLADECDYSDLALHRMDIAVLSAQIRMLPRKQRIALIAHANGERQCDIAALLNLSQPQVSRLLERTRRELRSSLERKAVGQ